MEYIESLRHDAWFNMALEEYAFESLPKDDSYFMLWQNRNAVVVGRYQNTAAEINAGYVRDHDVEVVRRLSGGGAMFQDMGNLNFTFIVDQQGAKALDFDLFIQPVIRALAALGVSAQKGSRNDIQIDGKKFSGNAQYNRRGRTMHHGTLLFDSDLDAVDRALRISPDKIASKGVQSVRSRVTNIREHLAADISLADFKRALLAQLFDQQAIRPYRLSPEDIAAVERLKEQKYATWQWNYGHSPPYGVEKRRRYAFGGVEVRMDVCDGRIGGIDITGDFFGNGDFAGLTAALTGAELRAPALEQALAGTHVGDHISGMDAATLIELLLY